VCVPSASKPYVAVEQEYEEAADGRPHCVAGLAQHRHGIRREADSINQQAAEQKDETDSSNVIITAHLRGREKGAPGKELGDGCGGEAYVGKGTPRVVPHHGSLLCTIVVATTTAPLLLLMLWTTATTPAAEEATTAVVLWPIVGVASSLRPRISPGRLLSPEVCSWSRSHRLVVV
jgi:hypothetical protein